MVASTRKAARDAERELWLALRRHDRMLSRPRRDIALRASWARLWNARRLAIALGVVVEGSDSDAFVRACLDECTERRLLRSDPDLSSLLVADLIDR